MSRLYLACPQYDPVADTGHRLGCILETIGGTPVNPRSYNYVNRTEYPTPANVRAYVAVNYRCPTHPDAVIEGLLTHHSWSTRTEMRHAAVWNYAWSPLTLRYEYLRRRPRPRTVRSRWALA